MPEPDSNSTPHPDSSIGIYNPGSLSPETLLAEFIARRRQLDKALGIVRDSMPGEPPQHLLVLGPRGIGKTMFLLALAYSVERDEKLTRDWLPIIFPEETYGIGDLADFWLYATTQLLQTLNHDSALPEVEKLRDADPEDIEDQAQALFLKHLDTTGKRALLVIENLDDFFESVSDEDEQHRLRAFLMESDRLMFAASAPSYFSATGNIDLPFYDFFRIFRLERFTRDEMLEVLQKIAESRGDQTVLKVLAEQPERLDSLNILTGGNPRLIKMIYRLLQEGGSSNARQDLDRLLEDCTPYFKHRIEELKKEERRVFDHVARHWDPVAVGDIQTALRRKSNQISTYLKRLIDKGFLEEADGSTPKRKCYQVAERFYNIYYLMRFSRSGKQRLAWLVQAMKVLYSENDFRKWTKETLSAWKTNTESTHREHRQAFLHSLTQAADSPDLRNDILLETIQTAWDEDQLGCLHQLLDSKLAQQTLGPTFDLIEFFSKLPNSEKEKLGYQPDEAEWWYDLGLFLYRSENISLTEKAWRKCLDINSDCSYPWHGLGVILADRLQRFEEAEEAFRNAIKIAPDEAIPWNGLGNLLKNHFQRFEEAEEAFRYAIKIDPKYAYPWNGLGNLLADHFQRFDEAEEAYRNAIKIDPKYASPWYGLGNLLNYHLQRFEEAEEAYRNAIKIDPNYALPWNGLGNLLKAHLQRFDEAEEAYRNAIKIDPNFASPWYELGNLLHDHLQRFEEAEEAYRNAIKIDPKHAYPWYGLGNLLADHPQRFEEAEEAYRNSIKIDPKDAYPHAGLSDILAQQDREEEARSSALQGAILGPNFSWPRHQFLELCGEDSSAWMTLIPHLLAQLSSSTDPELLKFTIRGLSFLLSGNHLPPSEALQLIQKHHAQEPLGDIHLALQSLEDPHLLTKASPERKAFARDFLKKTGLNQE